MNRDKLIETIRFFGTDYQGPVTMLTGIAGESLADRILRADESGNNEPEAVKVQRDGLLDALENVLRYCVTPKGLPDKDEGRTAEQQYAMDKARAVIAKAKGDK